MRMFLVIFFGLVVVGCKQQVDGPATGAGRAVQTQAPAATQPKQQQPTADKGQSAMDINALVPQGYKVVDTQKGDLNGDGISDVLLLVEDATNKSQVAGNGAKRQLMILLGDAQGKYVVTAINEKIVPCQTCGGVSGDPFSFMNIDGKGGFTVVVEGGSTEHWADTVGFKYSSEKRDWLVSSLKNELWADGNEAKARENKDAVGIAFSAYDPAKFKEVDSR